MRIERKIYNILFLVLFIFSSTLLSYAQENDSFYENKVIEAVEKYNIQDFTGAANILEKVVSEAPSNDAAHYYLGLSYFFQGDKTRAEQELKTAAELDKSNFWYRYRLAMVYAASDRKELTISIYEELLKDFPRQNELYYSLIDLYMSENQIDNALETLSQIETVFGKTDATAMTRFQLLARIGKEKEAYSSLEEYNREYSSPQVLSVLGDYQMSMYNDSLAVRFYDEALELEPGYAPALLGKAETFRVTRKYDSYFNVIREFLADDSVPAAGKCDYLKAIIQRADPLFLKSFMPRIDSMIVNTMETHPNDSSVLMTAGVYYFSTGRNDLAEIYFRKNKENYPESVTAAANYVEMLMYMKDWDVLASEAEDAFRKFPSESAFLELASMAYYNKGDYSRVLENSMTILEMAAGDTVKSITAYSTMGDMYHQLGENKKAYKAYESALKLKPDYSPVLNNYAYYLSLEKKKLKKAASMSKITVDKEPDNPTYLDTYGWILYLLGKPEEAKPLFKHAMLYGGKESVVVLDHYAEVLFALKDYDLAMVYWNQAKIKNNEEIPDLDEKISRRKAEMK